MSRTTLERLGEQIGQGLHLENLYPLVRLCRDLEADPAFRLPAFVLHSVFQAMADRQGGVPSSVEVTVGPHEAITEAAIAVVSAIRNAADVDETWQCLDALVEAYKSLPPEYPSG